MTDLELPDLSTLPDLGGRVVAARVSSPDRDPDRRDPDRLDPARLDPARLDPAPRDPLAGTLFARVTLPAGIVGFGFGELRHILARQDSPAARRSSLVLGFDVTGPTDDASDVIAAGVSSLLARGLMAVDAEGNSHTAGEAALLESLFATAQRWTTFTYRIGDRVDLLMMIEGDGQLGMFQARQYGTWFVGLGSSDRPVDVAVVAMTGMAQIYGSGTFATQVRTADRVHGVRYVASSPDGDWVVSTRLEGDDELARGTIEDMVRWVLADLADLADGSGGG